MAERIARPPLLSPFATVGLIGGILIFGSALILPPPGDMPVAGWRTAGLALMMAVWWSTEPVPIGVTALLPLIALPLAGIGDIGTAATPYANPLIFLFLGGFLLAEGLKRWGLHQRLALPRGPCDRNAAAQARSGIHGRHGIPVHVDQQHVRRRPDVAGGNVGHWSGRAGASG